MLNLSVCFPEELLVDYIENNDNNVVIELRSNQSFSLCPCCRVKSKQIHSYYNRALSDIPIINQKVVIRLQTRKFFCNNRKCSRSIFTERYNTLIKAYARRTDRLNKFLEEIAFATSAETAAKIITNNIQEISADTVIRIVQNTEIKVNSDYEAIGIDDFAFKKGNNYGTLVCDLKTNKPIAVIKDRDCSTVSNWLENYKQIGSGQLSTDKL